MKRAWLFILFIGLCHGVSKATECSSRGRFPNDDSDECRGYTMCLLGGTMNFTQYKLNCPTGFVYSHIEQQCTNVTAYQCLPNFICNETGLFVNPYSQNCSSYVACIKGISKIVTARLIECYNDQVFNPIEGLCVNSTEFQCAKLVENKNIQDPIVEHVNGTVNFSLERPLNSAGSLKALYAQFVLMSVSVYLYK